MVTKGDLPLDITWSWNGESLRNGENGINIVKMSSRLSSLSIESIHGHHRGSYECIAKNAAGVTNSTTELLVNGLNNFFLNNVFITFK